MSIITFKPGFVRDFIEDYWFVSVELKGYWNIEKYEIGSALIKYLLDIKKVLKY